MYLVLVLQTATDAPLLTQRLVLSDSRAVVQIINYDIFKGVIIMNTKNRFKNIFNDTS